MGFLRICIRLPLFIFATLFCYLFIMVGVFISDVGFNGQSIRRYFLGLWGKSISRIIGMKIIVEGKIPKPPFFFVSNHLSYVDVFILSATIKCLFVAKDEMKRWPIFGTIVSTAGMIFVNREKRSDVKRVNGEISKRISRYNGVTMFPESTTSQSEEHTSELQSRPHLVCRLLLEK